MQNAFKDFGSLSLGRNASEPNNFNANIDVADVIMDYGDAPLKNDRAIHPKHVLDTNNYRLDRLTEIDEYNARRNMEAAD